MIGISNLSSRYRIRRLNEADLDDILRLYRENPQFYRYTEAKPTPEQARNDMRIAPPGIGPGDKYFIGFFEGETLVAVLDLVDGYPTPETAYIGLFMMHKALQGQGIGSAIVGEVQSYLQTAGKTAIRLAIDKENPQSTHFWKKNGFAVIKEVNRNGWPLLVAEKPLL